MRIVNLAMYGKSQNMRNDDEWGYLYDHCRLIAEECGYFVLCSRHDNTIDVMRDIASYNACLYEYERDHIQLICGEYLSYCPTEGAVFDTIVFCNFDEAMEYLQKQESKKANRKKS